MSAINYLTYGERSVMVAKPASYLDLKREIRKHFPMLASVFNIVVLYRPKPENGTMLNHYVEVDPSAYSAIHDGAEIFINVAEPITKRYLFPLPDGNTSNVGPQNQMAHTDGLGNRVDLTKGGGVLLDTQVSTKQPKSSKYIYPGTGPSLKPEGAVGAACASGWADASERFRRSSKLIPNLEDCQEAVGLEVGESNCYPEDEENADNGWGPVKKEKEVEASQALTEKGWYTGTEDFVHAGRHDVQDEKKAGEMIVADTSTVLPAGRALVPLSDRPDETSFYCVGKNIPNTTVNNVQEDPFLDATQHCQQHNIPMCVLCASAIEADQPSSECSPRRGADVLAPWPVTPGFIEQQRHNRGAWGKAGSPFSPAEPQDIWSRCSGGWSRCGAWAPNVEHEHEDKADQQPACTAYNHSRPFDDGYGGAWSNAPIYSWGNKEQMAPPAALPAPTTPISRGYSNQVSQYAQNYAGDYGGSDWSPLQKLWADFLGQHHESPVHQGVLHQYPPGFSLRPSYGSFTPNDPGRVSYGSPIAKLQRRGRPRRIETDSEGQSFANIGQYQQTQSQAPNRQQFNGQQQDRPLQTGFPVGQLGGGQMNRRPQSQNQYHDQSATKDSWYAPPNNATNVCSFHGGAFETGGGRLGNMKKPTDKQPRDGGRAGRWPSNNNNNRGGWSSGWN